MQNTNSHVAAWISKLQVQFQKNCLECRHLYLDGYPLQCFNILSLNDLSSKKKLQSIIMSKYESVIRGITMKNKLMISRHVYEIMTKTVETSE